MIGPVGAKAAKIEILKVGMMQKQASTPSDAEIRQVPRKKQVGARGREV